MGSIKNGGEWEEGWLMSKGEGKKVSSEVCNILLVLFSVPLLTILFLSHYLMGSLSEREVRLIGCREQSN